MFVKFGLSCAPSNLFLNRASSQRTICVSLTLPMNLQILHQTCPNTPESTCLNTTINHRLTKNSVPCRLQFVGAAQKPWKSPCCFHIQLTVYDPADFVWSLCSERRFERAGFRSTGWIHVGLWLETIQSGVQRWFLSFHPDLGLEPVDSSRGMTLLFLISHFLLLTLLFRSLEFESSCTK